MVFTKAIYLKHSSFQHYSIWVMILAQVLKECVMFHRYNNCIACNIRILKSDRTVVMIITLLRCLGASFTI